MYTHQLNLKNKKLHLISESQANTIKKNKKKNK